MEVFARERSPQVTVTGRNRKNQDVEEGKEGRRDECLPLERHAFQHEKDRREGFPRRPT